MARRRGGQGGCTLQLVNLYNDPMTMEGGSAVEEMVVQLLGLRWCWVSHGWVRGWRRLTFSRHV